LLDALTVLPLLLWVAAAALWVWSYWRTDSRKWQVGASRTYTVSSE
jgi:hypothetical protein